MIELTYMRTRPTTRLHLPPVREMAGLHTKINEQFGVRGLYFGQKQKNGEYIGRNALVVIVDRKIPKNELSRAECIPKRLSFRKQGKKKTVQTDVVQKYGSLRPQIMFNPGDRIRGENLSGKQVNATIGAFGIHKDFGPVFITAGHFSDEIDRRRRILMVDRSSNPSQVLGGKIIRAVHAHGTDYALVKPDSSTIETTFGNIPVSSVYNPILSSDIGRHLFVLASGEPLQTICRGLFMIYKDPNNGEVLFNLIVTDAVTKPGDSGAALVDENFRLWGFVIGSVRFRAPSGSISNVTVYMPAIRLLSLESLTIGVD